MTAPGSLQNTAVLAPESELLGPPSQDLAALAAEYGLHPSSARPRPVSYTHLTLPTTPYV